MKPLLGSPVRGRPPRRKPVETVWIAQSGEIPPRGDECLLRGVLGLNDGYVVEGHNGWNHVQLRAGVGLYPLKRLEIQTYAAYNIALGSKPEEYPDDSTLRDFLWGGIGIAYHF